MASVDMEKENWTMLDEQDVLDRFEKFKARWQERFGDLYDRMREDRSFLAGDTQWDRRDNRYISKARNRLTVNVVANNVNSVSNSYDAWPYSWFTGDYSADTAFDKFLSKPGNAQCATLALRQSVSFGLGVMCVGSEDSGAPAIYAVPDFERVMLDPDSTDLDGYDMVECALIDYRGKAWVRLHYGDEFVPSENDRNIVPAKKGLVPIVTYYAMEDGGCHVYELINSRVNDKGVAEFDRIPVFPVYGERVWNSDGEIIYKGIVDKCKDIQRLVNYAYTQLGERLALSPKPQFIGTVDAFKGNDMYYKESGSGLNTMLPYNRKSLDQKDVLDPPQRFDAKVQFEDLSGIIGSTLDLMTSVTGVDSKGLADTPQEKTATEVEYTASVFSNNVRHYFTNLKYSFKAMGQFLADWMGMGLQVEVTQGPDERMQRQVARQELAQLIGVANDNQKPSLVNAILKSYPDNEILAQTYAELNSIPQPTEMEAQLQQMCEQMKAEIDQRDQVIRQQLEEIEQYKKSAFEIQVNSETELTKLRLNHEYAMEEEILKAQLSSGMDADKAAIEAEKEQVKLETEIASSNLKLQAQAAKIAMDTEKENVKAALDMRKAQIDLEKSKAMAEQSVENARLKASTNGGQDGGSRNDG